MRHFDTFSGYGGFTIPAHELGWETIGFSEIDRYANAVLAYNFPGVKNYGDISKIDFRQFNGEVDIITGGTPCQDLSVAGKGEGLAGARSGLFFEFIRAISESNPKYFIWENVKGSLSSSKGWDMARVQIEMAEAGYSIEWRVLNATEFSVPQNRERIFIIGTRGGGGREILPKPEGAGQALKELTVNKDQGNRVYDTGGTSKTLAGEAGGRGAKTGLYATRWVRTEEGKQIRREARASGKDYTPFNGSARKLGVRKGEPIGTISTAGITKDSLVAIDLCEADPKITDRIRTLQARYFKGYSNRKAETSGVTDGYRIRRLTPTECERLMGLPDGWTSRGIIDGEEVEISDTQRYKMCGNGVVVDVVRAIYEQI